MSSVSVSVKKNELPDRNAQVRKRVSEAVRWATFELEAETKRQIVAFDFIESGDTLASAKGTPTGPTTGEVTLGTEQAVFGNFGTEKMAARPFASQAAEIVRPKFEERVAEAMR